MKSNSIQAVFRKSQAWFAFYEGVEKAVHFRQLLLRAIAEEIITMSKAATLDGKKLADFRQALLSENENSGN